MARQLSFRVAVRVLLALGLLGVLLAGTLAPGWFGGDPAADELPPSTTDPGPPATTLVPVDIRPPPPTTAPIAPIYVGVTLDGDLHLLEPDSPSVVFLGGVPLEIRRIDGLAATGNCDELRETFERWYPFARLLETVTDPSGVIGRAADGEAGDQADDEAARELAEFIEATTVSSVYARAAADALAAVPCE